MNEVVEVFIPDGFWFADMFMIVYSLMDYSLIVYSLSCYSVGMACCGLLKAIPALSVPTPGNPTLVALDMPRSLRSDCVVSNCYMLATSIRAFIVP